LHEQPKVLLFGYAVRGTSGLELMRTQLLGGQ
jgi:hypothetical protein